MALAKVIRPLASVSGLVVPGSSLAPPPMLFPAFDPAHFHETVAPHDDATESTSDLATANIGASAASTDIAGFVGVAPATPRSTSIIPGNGSSVTQASGRTALALASLSSVTPADSMVTVYFFESSPLQIASNSALQITVIWPPAGLSVPVVALDESSS